MRSQLRAQFGKMLMVPGLDRAKDVHSRNIRAGEGAVVHYLFDARPGGSDLRGEISESTGTIADHGSESAEATISHQAALDDSAQDVGIDVAATQQQYAFFASEVFQFSGETRGQRCGGGTFYHAFFQFDESQNCDRDLLFCDSDGEIDKSVRNLESVCAYLRNSETVGQV